MSKIIMLGTALWGWGVDRKSAYDLLDDFSNAGGQWIDAAVNYPINRRTEDFGRANSYITQWVLLNPGTDIKVFCKIGSLDNMGGAHANLSPSAVLTATEILRGKFFDHLKGIACHWDNRDQPTEIEATMSTMSGLKKEGLEVGFSGVARPDLYARYAPELVDQWWIQVKENAVTRKARELYEPYFPDARYVAYGINMGGVKTNREEIDTDSSLALRGVKEPDVAPLLRGYLREFNELEPSPNTLNELAMLAIYANPRVSGFIAGPRTVNQLRQTLDYWNRLGSTTSDSIDRASTKFAESSVWQV